MSGDGDTDGLSGIDDADLNDDDRRQIDHLSRDGSAISESEAERIVRFARLPRSQRNPSMLRMNGGDSTPSRGTHDASNAGGSNGSGDEPDDLCARVRRRMRTASRTAEVVDEYPDKHPSAIFRHAEGRCACNTTVEPTTSPRIQADECLDMRRDFRRGETKRDIMATFYRSANAVNKHLFGRCDHPRRRGNPVSESMTSTECKHLREAYRRNATVSVHDLAAAYGISSSTAHKHLRGVCDHDVDVDPIPPVELTDETCAEMRRDYKRDPRAVVARIARDHDTTRPTADYHIFGRCDCDGDEPPAKRRGG